jgi:hypothetical protein
LESLEFPKQPLTAFKIFENKQFNAYKKKMPHLTNEEISDIIYQRWKLGLAEDER